MAGADRCRGLPSSEKSARFSRLLALSQKEYKEQRCIDIFIIMIILIVEVVLVIMKNLRKVVYFLRIFFSIFIGVCRGICVPETDLEFGIKTKI